MVAQFANVHKKQRYWIRVRKARWSGIGQINGVTAQEGNMKEIRKYRHNWYSQVTKLTVNVLLLRISTPLIRQLRFLWLGTARTDGVNVPMSPHYQTLPLKSRQLTTSHPVCVSVPLHLLEVLDLRLLHPSLHTVNAQLPLFRLEKSP